MAISVGRDVHPTISRVFAYIATADGSRWRIAKEDAVAKATAKAKAKTKPKTSVATKVKRVALNTDADVARFVTKHRAAISRSDRGIFVRRDIAS